MTRAVLGRAHGPFIGLRPYLARDRPLFLGRDEETAALVRAWSRHRLTVLHGDNGVGKTSLVRAGAAPALADQGHTVLATGDLCFDPAFPSAVLPGQNPYTRALLAVWSPEEFPTHGPGTSVVDFLRARGGTDRYGRSRPVFAVLDSAELLLRRSSVPEQWRKDFLEELLGAVEACEDLRLLVVVRTGHLDELRRLVDKSEAEHTEMELGPFPPDTARSVVAGCLARVGSRVGAAEPARLVEEARSVRATDGREVRRTDAVEPALLQLVGLTLWEEAVEGAPTLVPDDDVELDRALTERLAGLLEEVAAEHLVPPDVPQAWLRRLVVSAATDAVGPVRDDPESSLTLGVIHALEDRSLVTTHVEGHTWRLRHPRLARPLLGLALSPHARGLRSWSDQDRLAVANGVRTRGEAGLAAEHAAQALRSRPPPGPGAHALFTTLMADLAFERGEHRTAAEHYAEAARSRRAVGAEAAVLRLLVAEARTRLLCAERSTALALLASIAGRVHGDPSLRVGIGQVLWLVGQGGAALDELEGALVGGGGVTEARRTRGRIRDGAVEDRGKG
ncbi:ATP-binding protein [Nocardiopsis sp. MG754419]|uniref:ATP-binding protein n=1 Tax=Nocardiopsis sp. MG754419 TaxID=2259865 RepID=UPI001BA8E29B|nr:ATP-binding protein [Nocardiopsis sp. MG754419]